MNILTVFCRTRAIPGVEKFFPPARLGNVKDPAKIKAKTDEHRQRLLEDAPSSAIYGELEAAAVCVISTSSSRGQGAAIGQLSDNPLLRPAVNANFGMIADAFSGDAAVEVTGERALFGPGGRPKTLDRQSVVGETRVFSCPSDLAGLHSFLQGLSVDLIIGCHPTTHTRAIQNAFIREKLSIPDAISYRVERLNVFELLCPRSEAEYPDCLAPLGLVATGNPIEDTIKVASILGVI